MKNSMRWLVVFLLTVIYGQALAGDQDPKTDWRPNFMYGTSEGVSPDYIKLKKWLNEVSIQVEKGIKQVIGADTYNHIASAINRFTASIKTFFAALGQEKRFEWKASREEGPRRAAAGEMQQYDFRTNK